MKKVWKLAPYETFEVKAIEGWLDELSQQGLQFRLRFGPVCIFERTPSPARYRVDIRRKNDCDRTDAARFALYREMGWEYCSDYGGQAEIYRAEDPDAPELHTDEEVLSELVRSCCRNHLVMCALFVWQIVYITYSNFQFADRWSDWGVVIQKQDIIFFIACGAFCLAMLMTIILTLVRWMRLRRSDYRCSQPHTPKRALRGTLWLLVRLVLIAIFVLSIPFTLFSLL